MQNRWDGVKEGGEAAFRKSRRNKSPFHGCGVFKKGGKKFTPFGGTPPPRGGFLGFVGKKKSQAGDHPKWEKTRFCFSMKNKLKRRGTTGEPLTPILNGKKH